MVKTVVQAVKSGTRAACERGRILHTSSHDESPVNRNPGPGRKRLLPSGTTNVEAFVDQVAQAEMLQDAARRCKMLQDARLQNGTETLEISTQDILAACISATGLLPNMTMEIPGARAPAKPCNFK